MKVVRMIIGVAAAIGMLATATSPAFAANSTDPGVQGYAADAPLDHGTIVRMTGKNSNQATIATRAQLQNMFGVTVDRNQLPLTVTNDGLKNEVFVATSGTYDVLVSTQGGAISAGDYVTLSSVDGVAMKAGTADKDKIVFGRAADSFDGKGVALGTTVLKDDKGKTNKTVTLGLIPVTIDIRSNPNQKSTKVKVPSFLERIGLAPAEKQVSPIRIYLSLAVTAACIIAAVVILYSGVRSGVTSIGRNPMSKKSIFRALIEIILTCALILIIGLFAVYLLLKL